MGVLSLQAVRVGCCSFGRPDARVRTGSTRVVRQELLVGARPALKAPKALEVKVADRDPDTIKAEIDQAREQLAITVDSLAVRANPRRIADDIKAGVIRFVQKPQVAVTLAGVGVVVVVLVVRRIRQS